jgi:hypothetical protein
VVRQRCARRFFDRQGNADTEGLSGSLCRDCAGIARRHNLTEQRCASSWTRRSLFDFHA